MGLLCRAGWHNWKKWQCTPVAGSVSAEFVAGQLRQCADCWKIDTVLMRGGTMFNMRPLRDVVRDHITDLRGCVKAFQESEHAEAFTNTAAEMNKAADE